MPASIGVFCWFAQWITSKTPGMSCGRMVWSFFCKLTVVKYELFVHYFLYFCFIIIIFIFHLFFVNSETGDSLLNRLSFLQCLFLIQKVLEIECWTGNLILRLRSSRSRTEFVTVVFNLMCF